MNDLFFSKMRMASKDDWRAGIRRDSTLFDWCAALPNLPDEKFQRRFVGKAYGDAMQQAFEAVEEFRIGIEKLGCQICEDDIALDFGCGWGRISQSLYRYFKPENIISADIQTEAVEFCRSSGLRTNITQVCNQNLAQVQDNSVDYVFAFSVFSHLNEQNANNWIAEFIRILKPGGAIAVTTRAPSMLRHVTNLLKIPKEQIPPHAYGLIDAFSDVEKALVEYNAGKFVYRDYPGLTKSGAGYGEALIPEAYVKNAWQPLFGGDTIFAPPSGTIDQAIIFIRKEK